jgi:hypothetical protein
LLQEQANLAICGLLERCRYQEKSIKLISLNTVKLSVHYNGTITFGFPCGHEVSFIRGTVVFLKILLFYCDCRKVMNIWWYGFIKRFTTSLYICYLRSVSDVNFRTRVKISLKKITKNISLSWAWLWHIAQESYKFSWSIY